MESHGRTLRGGWPKETGRLKRLIRKVTASSLENLSVIYGDRIADAHYLVDPELKNVHTVSVCHLHGRRILSERRTWLKVRPTSWNS